MSSRVAGHLLGLRAKRVLAISPVTIYLVFSYSYDGGENLEEVFRSAKSAEMFVRQIRKATNEYIQYRIEPIKVRP